jgi:hypothetical protein
MLFIFPGTKLRKKFNMKKETRELKWYTRKYLLNTKEGCNGEKEQQKLKVYIKQVKFQV